jgi:hypothetical protein
MPTPPSREILTQMLQEIAAPILGPTADSAARQRLLQQTAEELWQVTQAPVHPEDEPALLP